MQFEKWRRTWPHFNDNFLKAVEQEKQIEEIKKKVNM